MRNYDDKLIAKYISESSTIAEVLRKLGLDPKGRNYKIVKDTIKKYNLDSSHFLGKSHAKNKPQRMVDWNEILIENSSVTLHNSRKKRLIKEGLLKNECYICKLTSWLDCPISLQIDHINGISNDHRLENLRMLCPNCHSQTETFAGRNIKKNKKSIKNVCQCGKEKHFQSQMCSTCFNKTKLDKLTKISWPCNDTLLLMIEQSNMFQVSKKLGVSSNAIKKRLKNRGLI
jgi:hypothetical protein